MFITPKSALKEREEQLALYQVKLKEMSETIEELKDLLESTVKKTGVKFDKFILDENLQLKTLLRLTMENVERIKSENGTLQLENSKSSFRIQSLEKDLQEKVEIIKS